ncbi:MAG: hypothetical protein P1V97_19875 [Planctomycetota bacterium]|nr:hypothetical protein [Planctomycetota bacterium]
MIRIFAGLSMWAMLFLIATITLGFMVKGGEETWWHIQVALGTAVGITLLHSIVFVHLLGTGLGVKRATFEHKIPDEPIVQALWKLKMRAYPPAFFCMALTIMVAVGGGAVQQDKLDPFIHQLMAFALLAVNLITIPIEFKVINENTALMRDVEAQIEGHPAKVSASSNTQPAKRNEA